ncbi:MAG: N-acetyl-gamma-glutamyl-phosphate reductase [bacterium]|nr:N-acetyl-gamma-glutamyl-phosphate reductase [bacterium]
MPADTHTQPSIATKQVGLIGARGYVGVELLEIIESHPLLDLAYASSRSFDGDPIAKHAKVSFNNKKFEQIQPAEIAQRDADIVILALPDAAAAPFLAALEAKGQDPQLILDLSADHRFDDNWAYGLTEHNRDAIADATKISNPGCYATAAQLALKPIADQLADTPHCFGVSGYSGAGTKRTSRNDHRALLHGVLPYKLVNHTHEREITRHLGTPVRFSPHVAPFFRGISLTVQAKLREPVSIDQLNTLYKSAYEECNLIEVTGEHMPRVQDIVSCDGAVIGGIAINPDRPDEIAVVSVIDNLRKGAASQAIQNINLAMGYDELMGLTTGNEGDGA